MQLLSFQARRIGPASFDRKWADGQQECSSPCLFVPAHVTTFPASSPPLDSRGRTSPLLASRNIASSPIRFNHVYATPPTPTSPALRRQIPLTLDQSVHAPPPSMHFSGSVHSTRSASSTLKSVGATAAAAATTDDGGADDDSASANAASGGGALSLGRRRQLDAVRNRVSAAALFILEHYAETTGRRFADVLEVSFFFCSGSGQKGFDTTVVHRGGVRSLLLREVPPGGGDASVLCT